MVGKHRLDRRKCLEAVVYVASRVPDRHGIMKAMYLAEKCHLERYGRPVYSDTWRAADYGPVASHALDTVHVADGKRVDPDQDTIKAALSLKGNAVVPTREPDLRFLSASEVECLDAGVEMVKDKSFEDRTEMSHDAAWCEARANRQDKLMTLESIIRTLPNADEILDYVYSG